MRALITGKGGQLASELEQSAPQGIEVISLGLEELDISDIVAVNGKVGEIVPDVVINAAAYTAVDVAERESEGAYACNEAGPRLLASACRDLGARLIHVSTDFVFDGQKSSPYEPSDATHPLGVYGASKLAGEQAVLTTLPNALVVRTGWLYSIYGQNFVKTMLRLMQEKPQLSVVSDQIGTPTWAKGLADCLWRAVQRPDVNGILHWSDAGVASWYDFAMAIQELALQRNLLQMAVPIRPISSAAYPTPAARPAYSVLDKSKTESALGLEAKYWRYQLAEMLDNFCVSSND